jgi:hypothetical protein
MFKEGKAGRFGHQLEAPWDSLVRLSIFMALMPGFKVAAGSPVRNQPELIRIPVWAENVHANKARCAIDLMRPTPKCCGDLREHPIGYYELA